MQIDDRLLASPFAGTVAQSSTHWANRGWSSRAQIRLGIVYCVSHGRIAFV